jgi:hypothetical protein
MWKYTRILFAVTFCLLLIGSVGCTRSRKSRVRAGGEVTVAGQPVKQGRISFTPTGGGTKYSGTVRNGRYTIRGRSTMPAGQYTATVEYAGGGVGRGYDTTRSQTVAVGGLGRKWADVRLP